MPRRLNLAETHKPVNVHPIEVRLGQRPITMADVSHLPLTSLRVRKWLTCCKPVTSSDITVISNAAVEPAASNKRHESGSDATPGSGGNGSKPNNKRFN